MRAREHASRKLNAESAFRHSVGLDKEQAASAARARGTAWHCKLSPGRTAGCVHHEYEQDEKDVLCFLRAMPRDHPPHSTPRPTNHTILFFHTDLLKGHFLSPLDQHCCFGVLPQEGTVPKSLKCQPVKTSYCLNPQDHSRLCSVVCCVCE